MPCKQMENELGGVICKLSKKRCIYTTPGECKYKPTKKEANDD